MENFLQKINGVYETVECRAQLEADAFEIQDLYIDTVGIDENNKNDPLFPSGDCRRAPAP